MIWPGDVALSILRRTSKGRITSSNACETSEPQTALGRISIRRLWNHRLTGGILNSIVLSSFYLVFGCCVYISHLYSTVPPHSPPPLPPLPRYTEEAGKQDGIFPIPLDLRLPVTWPPPSRHHRRFVDPGAHTALARMLAEAGGPVPETVPRSPQHPQ